MTPVPIEPDTKDWTWVLERPCDECGLDASTVPVDSLDAALRDNAEGWRLVLAGSMAEVARRPREDVWSPLEYACHVRDVHRLFAERVRLMLTQDDPAFPGWDQDEAAVAMDYAGQDPATVSEELVAAADEVASTYAALAGAQWDRTGRRDDGSSFTAASLGRYHLHDVAHHLHDVGHDPVTATVAAYDADALAYREATLELPDWLASLVERLSSALPPGARVLEIGSAQGRDAAALESAGLSVRRTDITPAFVDLMRGEGLDADVVDPLRDELADPRRRRQPYDAVWASGSLLHVARRDLPTVLTRLAAVTRPDGLLHLGLKEGDGETWSTHGSVSAPRHFTFWREEPLREVLTQAGWAVLEVERHPGRRDDAWLNVIARHG